MRPEALEHAVRRDRDAGRHPIFVAATVGTTSTTSVDPVPAIADIAERYGMWLHVDSAYAGSAMICPEFRWAFEGCHVTRDIPSLIGKGGFNIEQMDAGYLAPFPKSGPYCWWGVAQPDLRT